MVPVAMMSADAAARHPPLPSPRPRPHLVQSDRSPTVEIGASLTHKCAKVAATFARTDSITVTCQTVHEQLPRAVATQLASIAAELVASAFNAFERSRGGRIEV